MVEEKCDHFSVVEISNMFPFTAFLIFCYIPPLDSDYICKSCDNHYIEQLTDLVVKYSSKGCIGVCGDLNARTGLLDDRPASLYNNDKECIQEGLTAKTWVADSTFDRVSRDNKVHGHGKDLINLCIASGLRIMNGRCYQDKGIGEYTYVQNDKKSVIDYLLVQEQMFPVLSHFEVGTKWPESDHRPIIFHFNVQRPTCNNNSGPENVSKYRRFYWNKNSAMDVRKCLFDNVGTMYAQKFYDSICSLETPDVVGDMFTQFINQACVRSLKQTKNTSSKKTFPVNYWFDTECKAAKTGHKDAQKLYDAESEIVNKLGRDFKKLTRRKKRVHQRKQLSEIMQCKNRKELWGKLNSFNRDSPDDDVVTMQDFFEHFSKPPINNTENKFEFDVNHEAEILNFFRQFNEQGAELPDDCKNGEIREILDAIISEDEIYAALRKLKSGKSPGLDGVPIDLFKSLDKDLMPMLTKLFNYIVEMGCFPENWASGCINPVPKNSNPDAADQFRRISVLPAVNKIFDTIVNTRLKFVEAAYDLKDPFNGGFESNSMTSDNIFILNGLIEKA